MYFNIGMKTIYLEVFQQGFGFPPITTRKGKIAWYCLGPVYWILAFIVAAAVPNIGGIVSFVGALFMINFTYSFPGMLYLGHTIQKAAVLPGEGFNPYTRETIRMDQGTSRWIRGFKKSWTISLPTTIYVIAGLACCGMGIWAAIEGLISVFGPGGTVATCKLIPDALNPPYGFLLTIISSFRLPLSGIDSIYASNLIDSVHSLPILWKTHLHSQIFPNRWNGQPEHSSSSSITSIFEQQTSMHWSTMRSIDPLCIPNLV
jgi:hypothetical protein